MEKYFNFNERERELYMKWEGAKLFEFQQEGNTPIFNICMPPPNANGELHLGHSLGYVVMDILGRYHRMQGKRVLLLPGKDHAGIQTQVVFEKLLEKEGKNIGDMSREDFYEQCYQFCMDRSNYMRDQEKTLGLSADWDKEIFTLDPRLNTIVFQTFTDMWKDGLVYKGKRIIHWSVYSQTAISDIEVDYKEEKGHLWHISYPLSQAEATPNRPIINDVNLRLQFINNNQNEIYALVETEQDITIGEIHRRTIKTDEDTTTEDWVVNAKLEIPSLTELDQIESISSSAKEELTKRPFPLTVYILLKSIDVSNNIVVATTRPETMLGDTAIAVHPLDLRYRHLIGKNVIIPLQNREIPIIADDRAAMGFGTGAVKITPAHDFLDFDIGETHKLDKIQVINKLGKMTKAAGKDYEGLTTLECRAKLVEDLKENFIVKIEKIKHKVPISERGKDVIEPLISEQWFINVDKDGNSLKKRALKFIEEDKINIYPSRLKTMFVQWLTNLRDWNISRQIIWGHRMPVWYNKDNDDIYVGIDNPEGEQWEQEKDTFDTWFSSGQWTYSTLAANGFLNINEVEKSDLFPNNTMVMGKDILFFWACRMLLFATYRFDTIPWKNIYFTGLILDKDGKKMSKSKGNGIEPLELIKKYGTDALRLGLISGSSPGNNTRISEDKIKGSANFINKVWNACKFVNHQLSEFNEHTTINLENLKHHHSIWIIAELIKTRKSVTDKIDNYDLSLAIQELYSFTWTIFCDWYLEIYKIQNHNPNVDHKESQMVLQLLTSQLLSMLHPFIPFVTEEIYQKVPILRKNDTFLASSPWHKIEAIKTKDNIEVNYALEVISAIRSIKSFLKIGAREINDISLNVKLSEESKFTVEKMAHVRFISKKKIEAQAFILKPTNKAIIYFATDKKELYKQVLQNEMDRLKSLIDKNKSKLSNAKFIENAPEEIVDKVRSIQRDNIENLDVLQKEMEYNK